MKAWTILYMVLLAACSQLPPSDATPNAVSLTREEVAAFVGHYDSSWNTKNVAAMESIYGKSFVYFTSVGGTSTRAQNLEVLGADYYKVLKADRSELEIIIDGNTAIVSSRWRGNGIWKDTTFNDNQRCGLVIQKQNGQLKLLSEHCVEIQGDTARAAD
ncbi:nuclear transport factor 2 family protein [Paraflavitalea sp. CAU 1676]|uniref:nuclear transport factor 2 family protein n=1 Tax=Paraflavitalea sp. CAU 1676 TaxID=3032598 RepID=UPI0023DABDA1|nr:nuclear transport factor 2 family protein [Paraflavitalea sp. CAU 1676]MDF2190073.1 nuclear transport factor 2 family protein [Paraflavitalea sp. CAU 1676]